MRDRRQGLHLAARQVRCRRILHTDRQYPVRQAIPAVLDQLGIRAGQKALQLLALGRPDRDQRTDLPIEDLLPIQRHVVWLHLTAIFQHKAGDTGSRLPVINLAMQVGVQETLHRQRIQPVHHHLPTCLALLLEEGDPVAFEARRRLDPGEQTRLGIADPQITQHPRQALLSVMRIVVAAGSREQGSRLVDDGDVSAAFADIYAESYAFHATS